MKNSEITCKYNRTLFCNPETCTTDCGRNTEYRVNKIYETYPKSVDTRKTCPFKHDYCDQDQCELWMPKKKHCTFKQQPTTPHITQYKK